MLPPLRVITVAARQGAGISSIVAGALLAAPVGRVAGVPQPTERNARHHRGRGAWHAPGCSTASSARTGEGEQQEIPRQARNDSGAWCMTGAWWVARGVVHGRWCVAGRWTGDRRCDGRFAPERSPVR